jgi:rubrerythrin
MDDDGAKERRCPVCRGKMARIVYGLVPPNPDLVQAMERGEIMLGGCVVSDDQPEYGCPTCRNRRALFEFKTTPP